MDPVRLGPGVPVDSGPVSQITEDSPHSLLDRRKTHTTPSTHT